MGSKSQLGTWAAGVRIARFRLGRYVPGGLLWALVHCLPLLPGLLLKALFDRVTGADAAGAGGLSLLAILVGVEVGRAVVFWSAIASWPAWWQGVGAWIRSNLLHSVLCAPGPPSDRLPASAGEAIGRFRDDVEDTIRFVDIWVDVTGGLIFTVAALVIMLRISGVATLVVGVTLLGVVAVTRLLSRLVRSSHLRMRERGSSVTDLIADLFAGALVLKSAGAEERALARFRARNASRREAAVRAQLAQDLLASISGTGAQLSVGLVLLFAASAIRQGHFTVGDLALFTTYATALTDFPRWLGRMLGLQREAGVALQRLARLHPDRRTEQVLERRPLPPREPAEQAPVLEPAQRLQSLEVRGLTARHPASGSGVVDVDLTIEAGSLTVLAGPVGSGKSTLIRALLGLIPVEAGSIRWNGIPVSDPGSLLVPPRAAYAGQVPRVISATLEENVRLGWPAGDEQFWLALGLAQLDADVEGMKSGPATVVGPRGSRLSGGQAQRLAIARAVLRDPQLLVLDDISSALDLRTEARLWQALRDRGTTCLAASNRRPALERATRIYVLDAGRVVASGTLHHLLDASPEFNRLWRAELSGKPTVDSGRGGQDEEGS